MDEKARIALDHDFARLANGDRSVIEPVFVAVRPIVVSFCARLVGSGEAEDTAQLALEKIFARSAEFTPGRPALPWILALAGWECRTVRARARRSKVACRAELSDDLADGARSAEEAVLERQLCEAAVGVLGALSSGDQEILRDAYWDEARDGAPASAAARKRKERALGRLRETWRRLYGW